MIEHHLHTQLSSEYSSDTNRWDRSKPKLSEECRKRGDRGSRGS